jgi:hypothetical protein
MVCRPGTDNAKTTVKLVEFPADICMAAGGGATCIKEMRGGLHATVR